MLKKIRHKPEFSPYVGVIKRGTLCVNLMTAAVSGSTCLRLQNENLLLQRILVVFGRGCPYPPFEIEFVRAGARLEKAFYWRNDMSQTGEADYETYIKDKDRIETGCLPTEDIVSPRQQSNTYDYVRNAHQAA
eukprot:scaffold41725_cov222-Skeletonema_dohrnii-CCMP3373.AAC.2